MARIKAKPMNRLPIAPPVQLPKNGFRATPPPAVYDHATAAYAAAAQQRYVYTNNPASLSQSTVPYSGQVMFVSKLIFFYPIEIVNLFFLKYILQFFFSFTNSYIIIGNRKTNKVLSNNHSFSSFIS